MSKYVESTTGTLITEKRPVNPYHDTPLEQHITADSKCDSSSLLPSDARHEISQADLYD